MDLNDLRRREADLLKAMAKATTAEQTQLLADLAEVRSLRQAAIAGEMETDLANAVVQASLQPVFAHSARTSAALDWLGEVPTTEGAFDQAMAVEASLWFQRLDPAVKADGEEFVTQAQGVARIHAGRYGDQAEAAERAFLDQALHLRRSAGLDKVAYDICPEAPGEDGKHKPASKEGARRIAASPAWLQERNNDPYGTPPKHEFWSTVDYEEVGEGRMHSRIFERDGVWYLHNTMQNYWMNFPSREEAAAHAAGPSIDMWASRKQASRKVGVSLTNVGIEGENGVGTDPDGNRVTFRLTDKEREDLKSILYSDLAVNFSGVTVDESDIIREGSRKTAGEKNIWGTDKDDVGEGFCPECEREGGLHYANCPLYNRHRDGSRKTAGDQVEMSEIPNCDVDASHGPAAYDARLPGLGGSWGYVCEVCFQAYGPGRTGTGHAQRLVKRAAAGDRANGYCPSCGSEDLTSIEGGRGAQVACDECGWEGDEYDANPANQTKESGRARLGTGAPDADHDPVIALLVSGQATTYQQAVAMAEIAARTASGDGYVWTINLVDDAGPYILGESEDGDEFPTIEAAVEDAKAVFDEYEGAEIIQVFRSPGSSYDDLVGGWSPSRGLEVWGSRRTAEVVDPWQDALDEGHTADPAAADIPVDVDGSMPNDDEWPDEQAEGADWEDSYRAASVLGEHFWILSSSDEDDEDPVEEAKEEGHTADPAAADIPVDVDATDHDGGDWPNEQGEEDDEPVTARRQAAVTVFDDPNSARWCADCPWNEDRTGTRAAAFHVVGDGVDKYVCAEHARAYDPSITASRRQAAGGFYVKRSRGPRPDYGPNDPPRSGWTGPIKSEEQAYKEKQAWEDSGWTAEVLPRSPEVDAEVRAWEKSVKEKQGAVVVDRQRAAAFRARVAQRKQAMDHGREVIWRVKGQDRDRSLWMRNDITDDEAMRRDIEGRWGVPADEIEIVSDSRTAQRRQAYIGGDIDGVLRQERPNGTVKYYVREGEWVVVYAAKASLYRGPGGGVGTGGLVEEIDHDGTEEGIETAVRQLLNLPREGSRGRRPFVRRAGQRRTAAEHVIPEGAGYRDFSPEQTLAQIGKMNVLAISGGRVITITKPGPGGNPRPVGISLPVSNGYAVNVFLDADDTYIVQRVFRGVVKGEVRNVYMDEVGEMAYQAGMFRSFDFGGHKIGGSRRQAMPRHPVVPPNKEGTIPSPRGTGMFRIEPYTGSTSGQTRYTLQYMGGPGSFGYGVWENVKDFESEEAALAFIENPEPWFGANASRRQTKATCVYDVVSDNHSDDIIAVHHGRPEPTYICGYHEQRFGVPGSAKSPLNSDGSPGLNADGPTAAKTAMPNPADFGVKVGDFFYTSWGYDQTNVEFYEVTGLTGASVRLREVAKNVVYEGSGSDTVTPIAGSYIGPEITKRLKDVGAGRPAVKINESATGWLWDGTPKYETAQGWGH